jgi:hypothetical protein
MDFIKKNKATLGGGIILVAAVYVYFTYFSGSSSAPLTAQSPVGSDVLATLGNLHSIRLDNGIFTDPVFVTLSDFGVTLPPQDAGRRNPFAPVGKGGSLSTTTPAH